ncbi:hypothetical protein AT251_06530 [Enterovibrio nigricans]|nr:type VI secretion system ImpA family N-terminal domain-containing protein [Enterovibrio nigricans]PKF51067.1 hypothetical protein AT251_06530 [Enterovibrio nigricans]
MYYSDFSRRPIDGEQPNGQNPNNLDEFDEIKRQINNLSKVTGSVSWKKVEELSRRILANHAKDIRCACYYGTAATHNRGVQGLVDGLGIISDICLIYWHSAIHRKTDPQLACLHSNGTWNTLSANSVS